ncbi:MAG: DNA-formamidopyrimidine glycosylase, partial [Gemmatimonadetes bacterium]|nr:DNA-formamidopyrimidine glycosylase [Gemmatimonadota bacterium]
PGRRARKLRGEEIERLHKAIRAVLSRAIEARGTTFRDYRDAAGNSGSYQDFLLVYGREGEPCIRCGARLRRTVIGGRSAFLCPQCQR